MFERSNKSLDVSITDFSSEGHGRGQGCRDEGHWIDVEVPFSVPGDEVVVELKKGKKKGVCMAHTYETTKESQLRIKPRCLHFGSCGGCRWQQLSYETQLKLKEEKIRKLFEPLVTRETVFHPIIPCTPPWNYRNKMELSFSSDLKGNRYLGLILQGTRGHVFDMEECFLMQPWMMDAVNCVRAWWDLSGLKAYRCGSNEGALRTLTMRGGERTGDRMVILTVSGNPDYSLDQKQLDTFVHDVRVAIEPSDPLQKLSIFVCIQQICKGQPTQFYEMQLYGPSFIREILHLDLCGHAKKSLVFQISPTAFFQPNTSQAEKLYTRAIELSGVSKNELVYDLFCGTGTLGICLSQYDVKHVIGVELVPEAILDARENLKINHISNVTFYQGDVGKLLPDLLEKYPPTAILVDPPRAGLDPKALDYLLKARPKKFTYVSCNPVTQAANLSVFIQHGYRIEAIQPVDQFPHTVHVENIVILTL